MSTGKRCSVNQRDFVSEFKTDYVKSFYILWQPPAWLPQAQRRSLPQHFNSTTGHRRQFLLITKIFLADIKFTFPCGSSCASLIKAMMMLSQTSLMHRNTAWLISLLFIIKFIHTLLTLRAERSQIKIVTQTYSESFLYVELKHKTVYYNFKHWTVGSALDHFQPLSE